MSALPRETEGPQRAELERLLKELESEVEHVNDFLGSVEWTDDSSETSASDAGENLRVVFTAYLAALSAASPVPQEGWQPIDTAPEGELVLIGGGGCPRVQENMLRNFRSHGRAWSGLGDKQQPTHWRPLPAPPEVP